MRVSLVRPPRRGPLRARLELALAAFAPAFALVGLRSLGQVWAWAFFALAVAGVLVLLVGAWVVATQEATEVTLDEIEDESEEVLGYISAYIVPVLIDPAASLLNAVIAALALLLAFVIHVAAGRIHINPLLYVFGYRIYTARSPQASFYLIARSEVADWPEKRSLVDLPASILVEPWRSGRRKKGTA